MNLWQPHSKLLSGICDRVENQNQNSGYLLDLQRLFTKRAMINIMKAPIPIGLNT